MKLTCLHAVVEWMANESCMHMSDFTLTNNNQSKLFSQDLTRRYAFLISSALAPFSNPNVSYKLSPFLLKTKYSRMLQKVHCFTEKNHKERRHQCVVTTLIY